MGAKSTERLIGSPFQSGLEAIEITVFLVLIVIFPLVDTLNGFFITVNMPVPVGSLYRLVLIGFLLVEILSHQAPKSVMTAVVIIFIGGNVSLVLLQNIVFQNTAAWLIEDFEGLVKYLMWVLIPFFCYQRQAALSVVDIKRVFRIINWFSITAILVPYLLGVGTDTYASSTAGFKGYFYAQNDVACLFIVLMILASSDLAQQMKQQWQPLLIAFLGLFMSDFLCLVLIGMKTSLFYGVIVVLYVPGQLLFKRDYYNPRDQLITVGGILCLGGLIALKGIQFAAGALRQLCVRLQYFYHLYDGNLMRLLTSSRIDYLQGSWLKFIDGPHSLFVLLCGQGVSYRFHQFGRFGLVEMDFFDLLFNAGLLGMGLFLLVMGYFSRQLLVNKKATIYRVLLGVILIYSFTAGHVLYSAISATIFGLVIGANFMVGASTEPMKEDE